MKIQTVDQHHQVLEFWAAYRRERGNAPAALTFDHHTDTLPAFGRAAADETERQKRIAGVDFRDPGTVTAALAVAPVLTTAPFLAAIPLPAITPTPLPAP